MAHLPRHWVAADPRRRFRERKEPSQKDDVHLTPSQHHGVMPQDAYMAVTGSRVVLNLAGADSMKHVEPGDAIAHLRSFQGGLETSFTTGKVSTAYTVIEPLAGLDSGYFRWVFKSPAFIQELAASSQQLRDGQSVKFGDFASIHLPMPPTDEQRRIADFLDDQVARIDQIIVTRREQTVLLAESEQSVINSIAQRHADEPMTRLGRLARVQSGVTVDAGRQTTAGFVRLPYLRVANVQADHLDLSEVKEVSVPADVAKRALLRPGDVLMTEGGDLDKLGRGTVWRGEIENCLHQNHVFAVRPALDAVRPEFLALYTRSSAARTYFMSTGTKSTNLASTSSSKVLDLPLPVRPLRQQEAAIADYEESATQQASAHRALVKQIDLLTEYKQSLITAAVTGELDVTTAGSGVPD